MKPAMNFEFKTPPLREDALKKLSARKAREMVTNLGGLTPYETELVVRTFLATFLGELQARNILDRAQLIRIAHIPLDILLANSVQQEK